MKKLMSVLFIVFALLVSTTIINIHKADAQDVWAYSDENSSVYVITETIQYEIHPKFASALLKEVSDDGNVKILKIMFHPESLWWLGRVSTGEYKYIAPIKDNKHVSAIWEIVGPRLEEIKQGENN